MQRTPAPLVLILVTFVAGLGWLFSKQALTGMPAYAFLGSRFLLASLLLLPFCWKELKQMPLSHLFRAAVVGVAMGLALVTWITALSHSQQLGVGAFISSLSVIISPFMARLVFAERFNRSVWLAMPLAVIGLGMLSLNQRFELQPDQLLFLAAAFLLSFHFVLNSRIARQLPSLLLTSIQLMVVGLVALVVSGLTESWSAFGSITYSTWGWFVASVVLATSLRFLWQTWAQGRMSTSRAALIMLLEPIWVAVISSLWLGERMSQIQLLGCGLIFTALLVQRAGGFLQAKRLSHCSSINS